MRITSDKVLLFIEPTRLGYWKANIDKHTIKVFHALKNFVAYGTIGQNYNFIKDVYTKGYHVCECGSHSRCMDYLLSNGLITNSLCVHYLAYHRDEVPEIELKKIDTINESEELKENELDELQLFLTTGYLKAFGDKPMVSNRQKLLNMGATITEKHSHFVDIRIGDDSHCFIVGIKPCPRYESEIENRFEQAIKDTEEDVQEVSFEE